MLNAEHLDALEPTIFENLVYDLIAVSGFSNTVWRTPGADGGRDIETYFSFRDAVGEQITQKWYIECKRYNTSISWPIIYNKLAYADAQSAHVLLLATNSNPSPACESRIRDWNRAKSPVIRVWRGYQIQGLLRIHGEIGVKYGIVDDQRLQQLAVQPLLFEINKIVQAAYASGFIGRAADAALSAAASIGELVQQRLSDLAEFGSARFVTSREIGPEDWLRGHPPEGAEELGLAAFAATLRYVTSAEAVSLGSTEEGWNLSAINPRLEISKSAERLLGLICLWTNIEIQRFDTDRVQFRIRENAR